MQEVTIRRVGVAEAVALQTISRHTFKEAFAGDNDAQNMEQYLTENLSIERLTFELHAPCSEFYFAEVAGTSIGYLKVNYGTCQTEPQGENSLEVERIYITKEHHGKGVAQSLFQKAIDIATSRNARNIWLGVWEHNHRALAFYRKYGFVEFGRHVFMLGTDAQTDIMMRWELPMSG
ncbi:MAG: GNAT family N-acetyltransferase [Flavipsychrobacter sp.]|nr:GNAT family N-acetyltransferase [Flavipsychrobacter sp.]